MMNGYDQWLLDQEEHFENPDDGQPTKDELIEMGVISDDED